MTDNKFTCLRCGHKWNPAAKYKDDQTYRPRQCPGCESEVWYRLEYAHTCAICGHEWIGTTPLPNNCVKCHSRHWNDDAAKVWLSRHNAQQMLKRAKGRENAKFLVVERKVDVAHIKSAHTMNQIFKGSKNICLSPNAKEIWCDRCKWGFDVFLPTPRSLMCPYCGEKKQLSIRNPGWMPEEF